MNILFEDVMRLLVEEGPWGCEKFGFYYIFYQKISKVITREFIPFAQNYHSQRVYF